MGPRANPGGKNAPAPAGRPLLGCLLGLLAVAGLVALVTGIALTAGTVGRSAGLTGQGIVIPGTTTISIKAGTHTLFRPKETFGGGGRYGSGGRQYVGPPVDITVRAKDGSRLIVRELTRLERLPYYSSKTGRHNPQLVIEAHATTDVDIEVVSLSPGHEVSPFDVLRLGKAPYPSDRQAIVLLSLFGGGLGALLGAQLVGFRLARTERTTKQPQGTR